MIVVSGSSNQQLAQTIAQKLGISFVEAEITRFANGEKRVWIPSTEVRGENVVLVQSFSEPADEHIMEFLLLADALERLGARHVNAVIPWLGYSLQDKVFREGEPISAKVVANLVSSAYVKRAFLLDLHNSSTPGFFSIPTQHLTALNLFAQYVRDHVDLKQAIVASPDFGGLKRARIFANQLNLDLIKIDKKRDLGTGLVTATGLHGDATGKTVLIFDDIIVSGSTVAEAARLLKEQGAAKIIFLATHGPLVSEAYQRFMDSPVDEVVVTNSIVTLDGETDDQAHITRLDVADIFANAISSWK